MSQIEVLLIDRSKAFMDVVSEWLMVDPAIRVIATARFGREAGEMVEQHKPDVVLVDATLPDLNGFQVARRLKRMPEPPLVVLVAFHDSSAARHEARAAGADAMIARSEVTEGLQRLIKRLVAERSSRSRAHRPQARRPGRPRSIEP